MATTPPVINIIHPSMEVIHPSLDNITKVARMARICYRSPDKGPEVDRRIISTCVSSGHTSVTEHGFVSVFMPGQNQINVAELGMQVPADAKISTRDIWRMCDSPDKSRYMSEIWDTQIYKEIESTAANPRAYHVTVGNFRAWMNALDAILSVSIQKGVPLYVAFICSIIIALFRKYPTVFANLVENINLAFAACEEGHYLREWFLPKATNAEEAEALKNRKLSIDDFAKYVEYFGIYVADADPKFTLSAIWVTSRAVTHELVRHRTCAFSQESQRYVNFGGKGFDFIAPSLDPVKFKGAQFLVHNDKDESDHTHFADLDPFGYIREDTCLFRRWKKGIADAVDDYVDQMYAIGYSVVDEKGERVNHDLPAEFCRGALPNDSATTIGVTWTPGGFLNFMKWRLEDHAFWPFRRQVGQMLLNGLMMRHPFFDNFAPGMIKGWIVDTVRMGIVPENAPELIDLNAYQDKRQKVFDETQKKIQQEMMARAQAQREAAKKAEEAKAAEDSQPDGK